MKWENDTILETFGTNGRADLTPQNKCLQQKVNDLLAQISVGNKE